MARLDELLAPSLDEVLAARKSMYPFGVPGVPVPGTQQMPAGLPAAPPPPTPPTRPPFENLSPTLPGSPGEPPRPFQRLSAQGWPWSSAGAGDLSALNQTETAGVIPAAEDRGQEVGITTDPETGQPKHVMGEPGQVGMEGAQNIDLEPLIGQMRQMYEKALAMDPQVFAAQQQATAERREAIRLTREGFAGLDKAIPPGEPPTAYRPEPLFDLKATQEFVQSMALVAAIAGAFTRQPLVDAMGALSAAVQGWKEGNQLVVENNMKQWKLHFDEGMLRYRGQLEKYYAIMENNKLTVQEKLDELKLTFAETDNEVGYKLAEQGMFQKMGDHYGKLIDTLAKIQGQADRLQSQHDIADIKLKIAEYQRDLLIGKIGGDEGMEQAVLSYGFFHKFPPGLGQMARMQNLTIMQAWGEYARDNYGLTPQEAAVLWQDVKVMYKGIERLTNWVAMVDSSALKLEADFGGPNGLIEVAKRLDEKTRGAVWEAVQVLTADAQAGEKARRDLAKTFNNPDAVQFGVLLNEIRFEWARLISGPLSNAQLHAQHVQEADAMIGAGLSIESLEATHFTMMQAANNTRTSKTETIEKMKQHILSGGKNTPFAPQPLPKEGSGKAFDDPEKQRAFEEWQREKANQAH